jgi:DNA-binding protein H-NS
LCVEFAILELQCGKVREYNLGRSMMATLEAIQKRIKALQAKADAVTAKETAKVVARIRDIMEQHGLTVADVVVHLGGKRRGRPPASGKAASVDGKSKGKLPPKYLNPKTGETWSGHARPPSWIAGVKDRTKFLIGEKIAGVAPAGKKPTRTGNYVRGLQPPKYREPKTGAEWSGRGRAPAWLAVAKDRTAFLIAGTADANVAGNGTASKAKVAGKGASVAKKTVTKKAATKKVVGKKSPAKKAVDATVAPETVNALATA